MSPDVQITLSLILTFGVPLGVAARELMMLRLGGWSPRRTSVEPEAPPPGGAHGGPELPACLIVNLKPVEGAKVPELV